MIKVLFVCLGNICRSPLAEAVFNKNIIENGLESKISGDSAGTANYHTGEAPDPRTVQIADKYQVPIHHFGQQFKKKHENEFHYLLAMDYSNYQNMVRELGNEPENLFLMRNFDPHGKGEDVPDPWYGGMNGFEEVYQILDRSTEDFLKFLRKKHNL